MKPLTVLMISFICLAVLGALVFHTDDHWLFAGNWAMGLMLIFTSIGHFKFANGMALMIPGFVPMRKQVVYASGLWEILLGIALWIPGLRTITGVIIIIFFVLILPVNISAALRRVNMEHPGQPGPGPGYLLFRVPLQLFFIAWVWLFSVDQLQTLYASHLTG